MALAAGIAGLALATLIVVVTVLPLSSSKAWWVRMWDFPRLQIAIATLPAAALSLLGPWPWLTVPALAACFVYQLWRIRPYTPLARAEIEFAQGENRGREVRLLATNVRMKNEAHEKVIAFVQSQDPDILFLMETDARWVAALEPVLARYPTVLRQARDDYYGLVFATRLPATTARTLRLTLDDTPAVFAELAAPDGGAVFRVVGLHPRPPVPGQDTDVRDAEVLYAARFARRSGMPLVAIGDFNDAAWSDTSQRFKHVGGYLDPRIGRGLYASFNANHWLIRCPIDQLFVTPDVAVASFGLGPHVGSDHFPIVATLRLDPELAARLNRRPAPLAGDERTDVEAGVTAHRDRLERRHGPDDYRSLA